MKVTINGAQHQLSPETSLQDILRQLQIPEEQGVAVALNNTVVRKSDFANTYLKEGDRVEIIHATAGG